MNEQEEQELAGYRAMTDQNRAVISNELNNYIEGIRRRLAQEDPSDMWAHMVVSMHTDIRSNETAQAAVAQLLATAIITLAEDGMTHHSWN